MANHFNKIWVRLASNYEKKRIGNNEFAIVTNNCWGYQLYKNLNRPYNTPFVGLYIYPDCYIKLLNNLDSYLNEPVIFSKISRYLDSFSHPVGILDGNIEIHFLHYKSEDEAEDKWKRRAALLSSYIRSNKPLFIKICDRDGFDNSHELAFNSLAYKNKLFVSSNMPGCESLIDNGDVVVNGRKLFDHRYRYMDLCSWIKYGVVRRSFASRIISLLDSINV